MTRSTAVLDEIDRRVVNRLQDGLPLVERPYRDVAAEIGIGEADLIARLQRLLDAGVLTRFGPFWDAAEMGGAFCLCAIAVPRERFEEVAGIVNAFPEVAHNYERAHQLNMWFVLATETPDEIAATAAAIEAATGLCVKLFPKEEEYFVGLRVAA